ncbi:MAG: tetratricopeptide repeat protein [Ignavibacteriaceae bacterium]
METTYQLQHKIKTAREFEAQGKYLHAVQIYNKIIQDHPELVEAYFDLADLYESLGSIEPGIKLLQNFVDKNPDEKDVRLFLGQYLLRNTKWNEAIEVLSYLLPEEEPVVSFFLGYSHFMLSEYEIAKLNFLNFISKECHSELLNEANLYLAKIEIELKNFESALTYSKKTEGLYANFWELNLIYSKCYYNLAMYAHAINPIEKAIKLNPKELNLYQLAGKIYLKHGDYLKAEKYFLKFIESIGDVSSDDYAKLAEACLRGMKPKEAVNYFDIAIKLDPQNKYAVKGKKDAANLLNKMMVSDG